MRRQATSRLFTLLFLVAFIAGAAAQQQQGTRPSRTTFAPSAKQVNEGTSFSFVGVVSPLPDEEGTPTGSLEFFDGTTSIGSVELASVEDRMQASMSIALAAGAHAITARYSGDATFRSSVSVPELVIVVAGQ